MNTQAMRKFYATYPSEGVEELDDMRVLIPCRGDFAKVARNGVPYEVCSVLISTEVLLSQDRSLHSFSSRSMLISPNALLTGA